MTESAINPYEPSLSGQGNVALAQLRFDGIIQPEDYQQMLPGWGAEGWLCLVLSVLLGICLIPMGSAGILYAFAAGRPLLSFVLIGCCALMLGGLWLLKGRLSSSDRSTRWLKKYPDLLGIAQGQFTEDGLSFHDGLHTYWFGPQHLLRTVIRSHGMRVQVDDSAYRYLALSARLFDGFNADQANRLKCRWRELADLRAPDKALAGNELWKQISEPPPDAIHFQGSITADCSCRTPSNRSRAIRGSSLCLCFALAMVIAYDRITSWTYLAGVLLVGYASITNVLAWWSYFVQTYQRSWYQSGWISSTELAITASGTGVRMPLDSTLKIAAFPEHVVLTTSGGHSYQIQRDMFANEEQWQQLCTLQFGAAELSTAAFGNEIAAQTEEIRDADDDRSRRPPA